MAMTDRSRQGLCRASHPVYPAHPCSQSFVPRGGITLIELLVVMGIIALVASLATVAFVPMVRGRALSSAAYALKNSVWQARTYAAAHNTRTQVILNTNPCTAVVQQQDPATSTWSNVGKPLYLPGGVRWFYSNSPVDSLQARVNGVVQLRSSGMASALTFLPSGSLDPADPLLGAQNVQIGLMGPTGGVERMAVVVLFASGLPYVEEAQ
jgi:prepilin-type N-terminal cleavage/methylation domain-containing protein